jgi:surface protein
MFNECKLLDTINLSNFHTNSLINSGHMFSYCTSLKSINLTNFGTINIINMFFMFTFCELIEEIDLSSFNNKDKSKMLYMFNGCKSLKLINLSSLSLNNGKFTDLIFKNIREDCKIICKDKTGLKKEIVKNDLLNLNTYNSMLSLNFDHYEKMKQLNYQELSKLKEKGIQIPMIKSKKNNFIFYYSNYIRRKCGWKNMPT